jgi:type II secretory pathway component PulF
VTRNRVLLTLNQLSVMSQNGIEIADALESVGRNCSDERLAKSLQEIHRSVRSGQSFSVAVGRHGTYFPTTLAPILAAAEATGEVPEALRRIVARMRGEVKMYGTIVGAMIYPVILIGASSVVMSALILGVLPQFSKVFASMGKPVPIYTQALLSFGDFCRTYWTGILPLLVLAIIALVMLRRHAMIQRPLARFLMYGPLIRDAYRPLQAGRNMRTIASMVQGGVPLLQAVRLSQRTTSDIYWQGLLHRIEDRLIDGATASSAMVGVDFIPPEAAQLMSTAERTGRVAEVLEDIGEFYEEEAERRIKRLVVALEPAIIVVMGVIVAAIVMSVMLPLLDVSTIG